MGKRIRNIGVEIILGLLLFLVCGCGSEKNKLQPQLPLYLIETAEYYSYDSAARVIYLKSPQQFQEIGTKFKDRRGVGWEKVLNILGREVSQSYMSPRIIVRDGDNYDITIHQHQSGDKMITVSSAVRIEGFSLRGYKIRTILKIPGNKEIIKFTDPQEIADSICSCGDGLWTIWLKDRIEPCDIVFEYGECKFPIPWFE